MFESALTRASGAPELGGRRSGAGRKRAEDVHERHTVQGRGTRHRIPFWSRSEPASGRCDPSMSCRPCS